MISSLPPFPSLGVEGLTFSDLFEHTGLARLDGAFLDRLEAQAPLRHADLLRYRQKPDTLTPLQVSELLLACAPLLEDFITDLFNIKAENAALRAQTLSHGAVLAFKKRFVQRRARKRVMKGDIGETFAALDEWLNGELRRTGWAGGSDREGAVARFAEGLKEDAAADRPAVERLTAWCVLALSDPAGKEAVLGWTSFRLPRGVDHLHLVPTRCVPADGVGRIEGLPEHLRRRDGFRLTDPRMTAREVQGEVEYCILCHGHDGDFCSKGFPEKKGAPERGFKTNPLGVILTGCPLEEKISEMHQLKGGGQGIAALAMAMVDNPMIPATGHRICNDCMKACIYQKQDPVDIPQVETRILSDVLALPWGVEIYDLLTRWNPLRSRQHLPRPYNGRKVLVAGMGPAGFTLAHHLTMEGCAVVGIDGLKIEPLPENLVRGAIRDYRELEEELDTRVMAGFGGVAEYGITVRWDKNFLKLIYLSLARRSLFQVFGGVRLGGTLTLEDAWVLGFDHVSIATGAGLPRAIPIENSLARGMRQSNDFLMALQLTGAAKASSLANLQVRLPAVVIGGGLTAIDTATEVQAYYIVQVQKTLSRYRRLARTFGEARVRAQLDEESIGILEEFLEHGVAVLREQERAAAAGEKPDFVPLLRSWGGVTVVYRRALTESPAYVRNHEEVAKALEEGIYYAEKVQPLRANLDRFGYVESLECARQGDSSKTRGDGEHLTLPARSVFVAAGATPNTIYEREHPGSFAMEDDHFLPHLSVDGELRPAAATPHCKADGAGPFTSYRDGGHRVSFIGDTHPVYHGGVVKAIASAQHAYPEIMRTLETGAEAEGSAEDLDAFRSRMAQLLQAQVVRVQRLSPSVVELSVRAPLAARNFRPGQFFRLQNFETSSPLFEGTRLQTESLALTGAQVDGAAGLVTLMVLELGVSSRLCATLREGDPVVLMGPTGRPTEVPENETILVAAGRRGAAVMGTLGPALRARGNRVLYFAGFRTADEVYRQERLEAAADVVIWCTASGHPIPARRPQDRSRTGAYLDILAAYAQGHLEPDGSPPAIPLEHVDRVLAIGSRHLLRMMRDAMTGPLGAKFQTDVRAIASVPSPMQCMLQGVCAQCLQWHLDPATGRRTHAVFSCAGQDQPLQFIDLDNLDARLAQNSMTERLTDIWLDYILARSEIPHV